MEHLYGELTPIATAVALSPMPVAALLLMLLSKRAKINSVGFLLGWIVGLALLVFIVSYFISASSDSSGSNSIRAIINGVLGVILILFALKEWKGRPKKGEAAHMPKWMAAIDSFSPVKAFAIGVLLATMNFKNTPMGISAATIMSRSENASEQLGLFTFYLLIGSITILLPTVAFLIFGSHIQGKLESTKEWLVYHNNAIMFVLFFILGAMLISKAFGG